MFRQNMFQNTPPEKLLCFSKKNDGETKEAESPNFQGK